MKTYTYRVKVETIRDSYYEYYDFDEQKSISYIIGKAYLDFGFNAKGNPLFVKIVQIVEFVKENDQTKQFNYYYDEEDYEKENKL